MHPKQTRNRRSPTMRQERIIQATIFDVFAQHEIGRELRAISWWLDEHRALLSVVTGDLRLHKVQETGRHGLRRNRFCAARFSSNIGS
jgi:hypothetical protein